MFNWLAQKGSDPTTAARFSLAMLLALEEGGEPPRSYMARAPEALEKIRCAN